MTKIMSCTCNHQSQDTIYGLYMRVFNGKAPKGSQKEWRCSVCHKERVTKD